MVLLLIIAAAGAIYVWYAGNQPVPPTISTATAETPTTPFIQHTKPAANAPLGASVQSLSTPLKAGMKADITIRTQPKARCTIVASYDVAKTPTKAAGLTPKTADEFGMISWAWRVDVTASKGTWPVTVTCSLGKKEAVVVGDLQLK